MAIALDAVSNGGSASSSVTVAHTCSATVGTVLFVSLAVKNRGSVSPTATYNGVSMTRLTVQVSNLTESAMFYLANPASGAHNIVAGDPTSADAVAVAAASYTVVLNATPEVTNGSNASSATSVTGNLTTLTDNDWVIMAVATTASQSAGTGATQRAQGNSTTAIYAGIYDNNGPKTPVGSVSEQVTFSSADVGYTISAIKPLIPQTVTEAMTMTEGAVKRGSIVRETITVKDIFLGTVTETMTMTEGTVHRNVRPKNTSKSSSTWSNVSKP